MKKLFFALLLFSFGDCLAQPKPVVIAGSQTTSIHSKIVAGQEYELQVMLPANYGSSTKKYPVVYLMDAQWDFPLVSALYGQQYYDGFIPDMIIVGLTWGGDHPNPDSLRVRDYTPTNEKKMVQSGGAGTFLSFMKNELFPFIKKTYRINENERTLMGCSLGGLFTLYALFTQPGLFQHYIAASPAIGWDHEVIDRYEENYFANKSNPPANLFICIGGAERTASNFEKFARHLSDQKDARLQVQSIVLENTGHSGTKGEGFEKGLQYAFQRPSVSLSNEQLKKYEGQYRDENGNAIQIKKAERQLTLYFDETNQYALQAANENDFYSTAEFLKLYFKKDDDGKITGFQLDRYGSSHFIKKIK